MLKKVYPSYVVKQGAQMDLWSPVVTGRWDDDLLQGRVYAIEMIENMRRSGHPTLLNHTVKAMIGHASWSGVEVGFFQYISAELMGDSPLRHKWSDAIQEPTI